MSGYEPCDIRYAAHPAACQRSDCLDGTILSLWQRDRNRDRVGSRRRPVRVAHGRLGGRGVTERPVRWLRPSRCRRL